MKANKLFTIITLIIFSISSIFAQDSPHGSEISFQAVQDIKLAFWKDDGHNNKAFTTDITLDVFLTGEQQKYGYWVVGLNYEFADLWGRDYKRYGAEAGYTFTNIPLPIDGLYNWIMDENEDWRFNISFNYGYGMSWRGDLNATPSAELSSDIYIAISDKWNLVFSNDYTYRGEWNDWFYNLGFGVRCDFVDTE